MKILTLEEYASELKNTSEKIEDGKVICNNPDCGWSWDIKDGGDDPYVCHKCGEDNSPVSEKKSPYDRETLINYKEEYEKGKEIPFGVKSSLIAQGMIPREGGEHEGEKRKSPEYGGPKEENHAFTHWNGVWENQNK